MRGKLAAALALAGILAAAAFLALPLRPADPSARATWFVVPAGASLARVADELRSAGLVRSARAVSGWARVRGRSRSLQAGRYRLSARASTPSIVATIARGDVVPLRLVFPEGVWLEEVAAIVSDSLGLDARAVVAAANDSTRLVRFGIPIDSAEGYLFPSTYECRGTEDAGEVVERLLGEGMKRWTDWHRAAAAELGLSRHEVLTLASVIEAETSVPAERAQVSAVYHRRLARGMVLQADPTVVYALGTRGHRLRRADLRVDSPYNTYVYPGLPRGPIGNPGDAAIEAALRPDPRTTALYFVAQPGGTHAFSDTYEEHLAATARRNAAREAEGTTP